MFSKVFIFSLITFFIFNQGSAQNGNPPDMAHIKGGSFVPLYGSDSLPVNVKDFLLDIYPVTNESYLEFVKQNPKWRKSNIKRIFSDEKYLKHWESDLQIGSDYEKIKNSPAVNISWFAAKAYCECQGKRLPTVAEWEYAALASATKANATKDMKFYEIILSWYSKPNPPYLPPVSTGFKNYYGVYGLIGMVWEWTSDFSSSMVVGESRADFELDRQMFCGAGSAGARDVENYAAFQRYAFRSSLKANYTVSNLGFRCAQNIK